MMRPRSHSDPVHDRFLMIRQAIREAAVDEGFDLCGIAPAVTSRGFSDLVRWIDSGYAAGMDYFAQRLDAYRHPDGVLPGAKSIVVLAFPYARVSGDPVPPGHGRVARYAWSGDDYHDVIHPKLKRLCRVMDDLVPGSRSRGVVDTSPLLEREIAQMAGLGWRAKNTLLIRPGVGSYFFLACVICDTELPTDPPFETFHCGTCTACIDACPTDAFPQAGVLDARRCISYLTIEHRGPIPIEFRSPIGDWLFGCDVCQDVCPWNRRPTREADADGPSDSPSAPVQYVDLRALFDLDDAGFRKRFRKTAFWRTRRRGLLRNAAIVLGNEAHSGSADALTRGLHDAEPIVRGTCAWAIGQLPSRFRERLQHRLEIETDAQVIAEIKSVDDSNLTDRA